MGVIRNAYKILIGKPERKRPLRTPRRRWEGVDWIHLAQDRGQWRAVVDTVTNLQVI
jgi:hypothetical protein